MRQDTPPQKVPSKWWLTLIEPAGIPGAFLTNLIYKAFLGLKENKSSLDFELSEKSSYI
jgi:hypothetical protein